MQGRAPWGGALEIHSSDSPPDDDHSSEFYRPLSEVQQSWFLQPPQVKSKKNYVDLGIIIVSRKFFNRTICALVLLAVLTGTITLIVKSVPHRHPRPLPSNYRIALQKSLMFFDAQYSGKLHKPFSVSWRSDSCLSDGKPGFMNDLIGGFYDGGDTTKFNFPASFAITMLSWSVIEYGTRYQAAGELEHVKAIIKWGTDYFLKTFDSETNKTISHMAIQVGVPDTSGNDCWTRPEDITFVRHVTICPACSDVAGEMAASLSAASIVFKEDDAIYSQKLVNGSRKLFTFAINSQGRYGKDVKPGPNPTYNSTGYWDEVLWSATWLFLATGKSSYLTSIKDYGKKASAFSKDQDAGVFSWDNKVAGAHMLLTRLRRFLDPGYPYEEFLHESNDQIEFIMCTYLPTFRNFKRTRGGLILLRNGEMRPLQYVVNAAFLATLYSDYLQILGIPGWTCHDQFYSSNSLRDFAASQVNYILGNNPQHMSYIVGFGENYPKHVHHMGASIPKNNIKYGCKGGQQWRNSKKPNPNTIVGAMVAGPDKFDGFHDSRANPNYTEPTLAGNAGLVAALVALSGNTTGVDRNTMFSSLNYKSLIPPPPPPDSK